MKWDLKRSVLGLASLLVVALVISACGSSGSSSPTEATTTQGSSSEGESTTGTEEGGSSASGANLAFISLGNGNSYSDALRKALEAEAAKEGLTVETIDGAFSPEKQLAGCQQVSTVGSSKYQALVMVPVTDAAGVPCAPLAEGAEIPLIAVGNVVGSSLTSSEPTVKGVTGQVAIPMEESVDGLVNLTVKACEGRNPCKIGWLRTTSTLSDADALMDEKLKEAIEENPNMEIAAEADSELEVQAATTTTSNFLQKEPELDVITSYTSQGPIGAAKAIEQDGKSHENKDGVRLVGYGCTTEFMEMLKSEEGFGCVPILPTTEGEMAVKLSIDAIEGKPVKSGSTIEIAELPVEFTYEDLAKYPEFTGQWSN